jgi:hypothetical protein
MELIKGDEIYGEKKPEGFTYIGHDHDCFYSGWVVSYKWTQDGIMFRLECWDDDYSKYLEIKR